MEISEIMIGDYVSYLGKDFNDCTDKVAGIIGEDIILQNEGIPHKVTSIHPIPLTTKILKGLRIYWSSGNKYVDSFRFSGAANYPFELSVFDDKIFWSLQRAKLFVLELQYVHELQQALRLCGLHELADNLKI